MKENDTASRLKFIMAQRGLKQVDILKMCEWVCKKYNTKFAKSTLSQYINGKSEPDSEKLMILSEALQISPAWLMGFDVPMFAEIEQIDELKFDCEVENYLINLVLNHLKEVDNKKKKEILDHLGWELMSIAKEME